ncbi:hypothetical protein GcM1_188022 [Golovinomyces cichoracearum]|uniref:Chitin-binding type-1 domain-containing protein n=1 Tax=Golovinomyces cichoracearum TaxID=62708 RepID=A0A420J298_9PEZI|nr:hypothetical protein GcM1_188022 [Golovinomyces cichoracearum]
MHCTSIYVLAVIVAIVKAHMELSYPAPFRSRFNSKALAGTVDYSMTSPLKTDGSDFPCKGYHKDMQDKTGAGAPVATWSAGSEYSFTVVGGATHNGGSCQAALSYDSGASFKVIHSYIGECPIMTTGNFKFAVPADAKSGNAIFAWSWVNQVGNREYYMNCASVAITGSSSSKSPPKVPFSARPNLFAANIGNGCSTVEGKDTVYPDPGPDVTNKSAGSTASDTVHGNCGDVKSGDVSQETIPRLFSRSENLKYTFTLGTTVSNPPTSTSTSSAASGSSSPYSAMRASVNGECGGYQTCSGSEYGGCCSRYGYCGSSTEHCGEGCMGTFGMCGINSTVSRFRMRGPHFRLA